MDLKIRVRVSSTRAQVFEPQSTSIHVPFILQQEAIEMDQSLMDRIESPAWTNDQDSSCPSMDKISMIHSHSCTKVSVCGAPVTCVKSSIAPDLVVKITSNIDSKHAAIVIRQFSLGIVAGSLPAVARSLHLSHPDASSSTIRSRVRGGCISVTTNQGPMMSAAT
jgi:hypothetical protein